MPYNSKNKKIGTVVSAAVVPGEGSEGRLLSLKSQSVSKQLLLTLIQRVTAEKLQKLLSERKEKVLEVRPSVPTISYPQT